MALKVYTAPKELGDPPKFTPANYSPSDYDKFAKAEEAWVEKVKAWCKKHGQGALKGEEVAFPAGDGYARYVVYTSKTLIHLPVGDAWQFPYVERLTFSDLKQRVRSAQSFASIFGDKGTIG